MPTISEQFHAIANIYNKITITVGCTRELLKANPLDALTKSQLKMKQEELVTLFNKVEDDILAAAQSMAEFKDFIYKRINKDTQL